MVEGSIPSSGIFLLFKIKYLNMIFKIKNNYINFIADEVFIDNVYPVPKSLLNGHPHPFLIIKVREYYTGDGT